MAGILLVTHNGLGDSLLDCVRHVLGQVPSSLMVLSVRADDDPIRKEAEGQALIRYLDDGEGVLLLAGLAASLQPALKAMRASPVEILRAL